jgi:hypothetical protein
MASRNTKTMNEADEAITRGTGNVFADLGFADAEDSSKYISFRKGLQRDINLASQGSSQGSGVYRLCQSSSPSPPTRMNSRAL